MTRYKLNSKLISRSISEVLLRYRIDRDDIEFIDDFPESISDLFQFIHPVVNVKEKGEGTDLLNILTSSSHFHLRLESVYQLLPWMSPELISRSLELFEIMYSNGMLRGRKVEWMYVGCIVYTCYELEYPFLIDEDFQILYSLKVVKRYQVHHYSKLIQTKIMKFSECHYINPYSYVKRYAEDLDLSSSIQIYCLELSELVNDKLKKHHPAHVAGSIIYLASKIANIPIKQRVITDLIGYSENTLRKIMYKIRDLKEYKLISRILPLYIIEFFVSSNLGVSYLRRGEYNMASTIFSKLANSRRPLPNIVLSIMRNNYRDYDPDLKSKYQVFDLGTLFHYRSILKLIVTDSITAIDLMVKGIKYRSHQLDVLDLQKNLAAAYYLNMEYQRSLDQYQQLNSLIEGSSRFEDQAVILNNLVQNYIILDDHEKLDELIERAYQLAIDHKLDEILPRCIENKAILSLLDNSLFEAINYYDEALKLRLNLSDKRNYANTIFKATLLSKDQNRLDDYLEKLDESGFEFSSHYKSIILSIHPSKRDSIDELDILDKAIEIVQKAIPLDPEILPYFLIGSCFVSYNYLVQNRDQKKVNILFSKLGENINANSEIKYIFLQFKRMIFNEMRISDVLIRKRLESLLKDSEGSNWKHMVMSHRVSNLSTSILEMTELVDNILFRTDVIVRKLAILV